MTMKRLLTKEIKRSIKEAFKGNAVFRVIDAAYKDQEAKMETLRFSPEEIFVNCLIEFDKMLKNREEIGERTDRMWNNIYCELRDDAQDEARNYKQEELETATSCILYSIIACMMASDEWEIIQHTESLMSQIAEHSELYSVTSSFDNNIETDFARSVKEYIQKGIYISERFETPQSYVDPTNPLNTPKNRMKAKEEVRRRLEFMKGALPDSEMLIMTSSDYNTMIEAVDYLIENNVVKKQESKIRTSMPIADLRYTFFLVYKNEGSCINRQLWVDFLFETFAQMQRNRDSLYNHFSDEPDGYNKYSKLKKKKQMG